MTDPTPTSPAPSTRKVLEMWAKRTLRRVVRKNAEPLFDRLNQEGVRAVCGQPFMFWSDRMDDGSVGYSIFYGTIVGIRITEIVTSGKPARTIFLDTNLTAGKGETAVVIALYDDGEEEYDPWWTLFDGSGHKSRDEAGILEVG